MIDIDIDIDIDALENEPCTACSGSGYYCGKACGACHGTGLEYTKDELIDKLKGIIKQLQNTSSNSDNMECDHLFEDAGNKVMPFMICKKCGECI